MDFVSQELVGPETECKGLRKTRRRNSQPFDQINRTAKLFESWHSEQVFRIIKVQAGKLKDIDAIIQLGIRWSGYHIHPMPQVFKARA
jgi:hypothetical protein